MSRLADTALIIVVVLCVYPDYLSIACFLLRLFTPKNKAENGNNNVFFNGAYGTGFGERATETKWGDQAFSSGNMSDENLGEHYYEAINDLSFSTNHSAAVLRFPDSLAAKKTEEVPTPTYETFNSGVNVDESTYQNLDSDPKSSEIRV